MSDKITVPADEGAPESQIGATLEALAATISARRGAGEESYTHRLLAGKADEPLKKVMEEAGEVALAAKDLEQLLGGVEAHRKNPHVPENRVENMVRRADAAADHLRYEAADVVYHLLVVLERYHIELDELAAELNTRMTDSERPEGAVRIVDEHLNRGK